MVVQLSRVCQSHNRVEPKRFSGGSQPRDTCHFSAKKYDERQKKERKYLVDNVPFLTDIKYLIKIFY
mgnify:FL=1